MHPLVIHSNLRSDNSSTENFLMSIFSKSTWLVAHSSSMQHQPLLRDSCFTMLCLLQSPILASHQGSILQNYTAKSGLDSCTKKLDTIIHTELLDTQFNTLFVGLGSVDFTYPLCCKSKAYLNLQCCHPTGCIIWCHATCSSNHQLSTKPSFLPAAFRPSHHQLTRKSHSHTMLSSLFNLSTAVLQIDLNLQSTRL